MTIHYSKQFKKDYKRMTKQGRDIALLDGILHRLIDGQALSPQQKDHRLQGKWGDCRECHLQPDWLLIYRKGENFISFERTGTHSELLRH